MINKSYLATLKGKKVIFKVVKNSPDLKVEFVDRFADYKVRIDGSKAFANETIKIQVVERWGDVKLQKVTSFEDFKVFLE